MFVVGAGQYSDFRVLAIFEDEGEAKEFIKRWNKKVKFLDQADMVPIRFGVAEEEMEYRWPVYKTAAEAERKVRRR
jgi:hypothetical protein